MAKLAILLIRFYQGFISKYILVGNNCKYYPTCSQYSLEAFIKYGFFKGTYLSICRILRCNPFSRGGYDPLE